MKTEQEEIDEKNEKNFKKVEDAFDFYAIKVGERTRWAYPAIIVTVFITSGNKVPHFQNISESAYAIPGIAAYICAFLGAAFDFLQFLVMAHVRKKDVMRFADKMKKFKETVHPVTFITKFDYSWYLFCAKAFFTFFAAIFLIAHLVVMSGIPENKIKDNKTENVP